MVDKKTINVIILLDGIIILILFIGADFFGFGDGSGFGYNQKIGSIAGGLMIVAGLFMVRKK